MSTSTVNGTCDLLSQRSDYNNSGPHAGTLCVQLPSPVSSTALCICTLNHPTYIPQYARSPEVKPTWDVHADTPVFQRLTAQHDVLKVSDAMDPHCICNIPTTLQSLIVLGPRTGPCTTATSARGTSAPRCASSARFAPTSTCACRASRPARRCRPTAPTTPTASWRSCPSRSTTRTGGWAPRPPAPGHRAPHCCSCRRQKPV